MTRKLVNNSTPENNRDPEPCPHWEKMPQVHFQIADGRVYCREPGAQHGFKTHAETLAWIERNTSRAAPVITGFYIEWW